MERRGKTGFRILAVAIALTVLGTTLGAQVKPVSTPAGSKPAQVMSLDDCIRTALERSHLRQVSRFATEVAEAQHRQVLSAYWPQVNVTAGYQRLDQPLDFLFPAGRFYIPGQTVSVPGGTALVTVPAGVLGPSAVQLPVSFPGQTITTDAQVFPTPAQDVKLVDEDTFVSSLKMTWLLFDGGMRKGLREQTKAGMDAAREEARRTDLEVVDSVRRMYFGSVLASQLLQVGQDTLSRMEATLSLTETMYKEGSGKVTKADFLDNKIMVETIRSIVALLEKNDELSRAALANTMGLSWKDGVQPADKEIPYAPVSLDLESLVGTAFRFSPDWARLEAGIRAAQGEVRTARSGHSPKLALTGQLHRWWNSYDAGISTDANKAGWTAGFGVEIPVFDGFLASAKVGEANAKLNRIKEQKYLLQEGIGLQVKDIFLGLKATGKSYGATLEAMQAAVENRDLNTRAYQNELVETEKVIRAQLVESLMTAQHLKARYDLVTLQSQLDLVVGTEVMNQLKSVK